MLLPSRVSRISRRLIRQGLPGIKEADTNFLEYFSKLSPSSKYNRILSRNIHNDANSSRYDNLLYLKSKADASNHDLAQEVRYVKELSQHSPNTAIARLETVTLKRFDISREAVEEIIEDCKLSSALDKNAYNALLDRVRLSPKFSGVSSTVLSPSPAPQSESGSSSSRSSWSNMFWSIFYMSVFYYLFVIQNRDGKDFRGPRPPPRIANRNNQPNSKESEEEVQVPSSDPAASDKHDPKPPPRNPRQGSFPDMLRMFDTKSAIRMAEYPNVTFANVLGVNEARDELKEVVDFIKNPKKFTTLGGRLPRGVLLTGPPGTGKTLLARAVAGEAKVPFYFASGAEFDEIFVGMGSKRIRELFDEARSHAPCIIFIDEIDAIGSRRKDAMSSSRSPGLCINQLLVEMDGFDQAAGVMVLAATNDPDAIDEALLRPGRFDKQVVVPLPDVGGRREILDYYLAKVKANKEIDSVVLAKGSPGFSGADLSNLVNEAAIMAASENQLEISLPILERAKDKVMMGSERKSAIISKDSLKRTAVHESGHAVVGLLTPGSDPIHKATIVPRGRALGYVMQLPKNDDNATKQSIRARLDVCMGGRVAEEIVYGEDFASTGAMNDFQQATQLATAMVERFGFSEKLGVMYSATDRPSFTNTLSNETMAMKDEEVRRCLNESKARVGELLRVNRDSLIRLSEKLLEVETMTGDDIRRIVEAR